MPYIGLRIPGAVAASWFLKNDGEHPSSYVLSKIAGDFERFP
jgi:hypothetical protein